ncbi:MAG: peptidoglycan-binding protein [Spirulina sp.]
MLVIGYWLLVIGYWLLVRDSSLIAKQQTTNNKQQTKMLSFSRESWEIAQTSTEETTQDPSPIQPSTPKNSTNHDLGLIILSISIFLFLIFLLLKRKSQEVRLSIFVSLFLGFLLTVYTSVQIATKSLIGNEQESRKETVKSERDILVSQTPTEKNSDRKPEDTPEKSAEEETEEPPKINSDGTEPTTTEAKNYNNESNIGSISRTRIRQSNRSSTHRINSTNQTRRVRDRKRCENSKTSLLRPILKLGDCGFDVTLLQTILKELSYYTLEIDGDYGISTELAVKDFQKENNLLVDGIVGFSTCNILKAKSTTTEIDCSSQ